MGWADSQGHRIPCASVHCSILASLGGFLMGTGHSEGVTQLRQAEEPQDRVWTQIWGSWWTPKLLRDQGQSRGCAATSWRSLELPLGPISVSRDATFRSARFICLSPDGMDGRGFYYFLFSKGLWEEEELFVYLRCFKQKKKSSVHCSSHVVSVGKVKKKGFTVKVNVTTVWGLQACLVNADHTWKLTLLWLASLVSFQCPFRMWIKIEQFELMVVQLVNIQIRSLWKYHYSITD